MCYMTFSGRDLKMEWRIFQDSMDNLLDLLILNQWFFKKKYCFSLALPFICSVSQMYLSQDFDRMFGESDLKILQWKNLIA